MTKPWIAMLLAGVVSALAAAPAAGGDAGRGREVFTSKSCAVCHRARGESGAGPALDELRRPQGAFELAGRLWNHVPAMLQVVRQAGLEWPQLDPGEMDDLMAYLLAEPARDPAPDSFKGQVILVRKGCLKCHRLRGEGARVGPPLEERRADYESAVVWAARMWVHTPRMVAKARELDVLYPRFSDDEMGHLVAFLRSAAR